jgi:flavin-dependent dehydrogenase
VWDTPNRWPTEDDTHTLVESFDGGWAWSVPVSATRRYVTVMLDPTTTELPGRDLLLQAYRAELARAPMLADLVAGADLVDGPWGSDASPYSALRVSDEGLLLIGDASSFVDPLSSFGVKKALASAWLGAVVAHTALSDPALGTVAMELFEQRERAMYEHLQRQSAALSRDAAGVHDSDFWNTRADTTFDGTEVDLDALSLRTDPRVLAAFDDLRRRDSVRLRVHDSVRVVDRPTVRRNRVVLEQHLVAPQLPNGARFCRNVDLYVITRLAGEHEQVPDLYDAYNRAAPPAQLPDFLGALSTLIGLELLSFA